MLLRVPAVQGHPTSFKGTRWIRVASTRRKLSDYPDRERKLWQKLERETFEKRFAATGVTEKEVINLLACDVFFKLLKLPQPPSIGSVLSALEHEGFVQKDMASRWNITNLGAILIARKLDSFETLQRKAIRLISYKGQDRTNPERRLDGRKGYAIGFEGLLEFLKIIIPEREIINVGLRETKPTYPFLAIRELIANALIHQDFSMSGAGPLIEVFDDRMEIANPGQPLGRINRLLDAPPRSRNEAIAAFMRRIGVCEEAGTGIDKVVWHTERAQLPPPLWEDPENFFRVTLFSHRDFSLITKRERIRACYLHACLKYVSGDALTNASLRKRFGMKQKSTAQVSRIISEALKEQMIKPYDPSQGKRHAKYSPIWG